MYDELVKRLRELASIPEHCENVDNCGKCPQEDICLSFTNKRIIEVATQAADAIEELSVVVRAQNEEAHPKTKPITNGDRIRRMTDEELAEFIEYLTNGCDYMYPKCYASEFCTSGVCHSAWLDWLGQEATDDP